MSKLDDALARFGAALDRVEGLASELGHLKEEREHLVARIAGLEDESRALAGLTEDVEERLDGAIAEIREVLGRN
jgi:predicted  nucleic acid-binding Zn-ribbon protein